MKIRTNRIAPLALATALAFGAVACDDTGEGVAEDTEQNTDTAETELEEGTDEAEQEMDEEMTEGEG